MCCLQLGLSFVSIRERAWLMVSCEMMFGVVNRNLLPFCVVVLWVSIAARLRFGNHH